MDIFSFVCSENLAALCILKYYETEVPPKQRQDLNDISMNTNQHCLVKESFRSGPFFTVVELCKDIAELFVFFFFVILK